jgi:hypothetical protein
MSSISNPAPGSRRVAAWIYTAINPLIDALRRELHLLQQRNLSWRYHSQRLEYIRPVRDYIEPTAMPNLEDFLADNSAFEEKFGLHDRNVANAEQRATNFYKILSTAAIFNKEVDEAFKRYESNISSAGLFIPSLESIREQLPKFVAENLINNISELPAHYTIHRFWKDFAGSFQKYLSEFDVYKERQSFRELNQAIDALKEVSSTLLNDLQSLRHSLCREFDIPAAPLVPVRSSAENRF